MNTITQKDFLQKDGLTASTPTTDNDGAEKNLRFAIAREAARQCVRQVLEHEEAAWSPCETIILEAAQKINAASPVGQDALAAIGDLPTLLARKLWETSSLRHGLFMPTQFQGICEHVIREALEKLASLRASASHANPTSGGPGADGVADSRTKTGRVYTDEEFARLDANTQLKLIAAGWQGDAKPPRTLTELCGATQEDFDRFIKEREQNEFAPLAQAPAPSSDAVEEAK